MEILISFHLKTKLIVPHSAVIFEAAMSTFLVGIALSQVMTMTFACQQKMRKIVVVSKLENSANFETQVSVLVGGRKCLCDTLFVILDSKLFIYIVIDVKLKKM